jgi:hypothetical protein
MSYAAASPPATFSDPYSQDFKEQMDEINLWALN